MVTTICQTDDIRKHQEKKFSASLLFQTLHEAQTPRKQRTQVSHSYEQADEWLLQVTEYLNITGMFTF